MQAQDIASLTFKRLRPTAYLDRFLSQNIREDDRAFSEHRPTHINVGAIETADGSCMVKLGSTLVIAGVKAEIARPDEGTPDQGWIVPNLDLSAGCSPRFKSGPPSDEVQAVTDRLLDILANSNAVPLDSLLIEHARAAWCLYIDIVCLAYDGNVLDAAVLAVMGALRDVRLPEAWWDSDKHRALCSPRPQSYRPLRIEAHPLSFSFGIHESKHLLADPSAFETALLSGSLTVTICPRPHTDQRSEGPRVSSLHASGRQRAYIVQEGSALHGKWVHSEVLLAHCVRLSQTRYTYLITLLDDEIKRSDGAPRRRLPGNATNT
ncbi:unnamed protein product [Tilletia laevis]|uniref:Ribosomal RNA-processing protein 43 n=2 Tax=Tilletia TaxID=13289 RepID=A0A9N8LEQ0_9BASI|nr:unnamed protein product [Tilletia caries]CAD6907237.1 unnamed protein product [Tilletia laevis]CAD6922149.1 unnamed protein product [Tilletia controversa]CAD6910555.1 unnamed protein product [Tilletia laevis]CAD6918124.1 unnamed protein product [Tilletia caries]